MLFRSGALCAKSLKNPWIFRQKDGTYGVLAIRTEAKGEDDLSSKGCIIYTATKDFIEYEEEVLLRISDGFVKDITCEYNQEDGKYRLAWIEEGGAYESLTPELDEKFIHRSKIEKAFSSEEQEVLSIEGAVSRNAIEIPDELTKRLRDKLLVPIHISTDFPKKIMVKSQRDLESIRATLTYSDGTTCKKRVDWYMEDKKFDVPGEYEIEGRIHQDHYEFPIAFNRADPCIGKWKDKYYFIATNDADNKHTL